MALGFVLITLGVVTGTTCWPSSRHKTQWISQPAIAISFVTWGGYMAMVFLRLTAGYGADRKAAIMVILVVGLSAVTWFAHARLGVLLLKP